MSVVTHLETVLADSYALYIRTHNFHWNVTGSMFSTLHRVFEEQYTELATAIDDIAERIKALDAYAPGSLQDFMDLTNLTDVRSKLSAEDMVHDMIACQSTIINTLNQALAAAEKVNDAGTADLITGRLLVHEKTCWMMKSLIDA